MTEEENVKITINIKMEFNIATIFQYEMLSSKRFDDYDPSNLTDRFTLVVACIYVAYRNREPPLYMDGIRNLQPSLFEKLANKAEKLRKKHKKLNPSYYH
jgi:hypothetical protein